MTAIATENTASEGSLQSVDGVKYVDQNRRSFIVTFNAGEHNSETLKRASIANLPAVRDPHPNNVFLRCSERIPRMISVIAAEVICEYGTTFGQPVSGDGNPLTMPADIEWDCIVTEEEVDEDVNGKSIMTVCGERLDPRLREEFYTGVIRIGKNIPLQDPTWMSQFWGKVNSSPWYQFPAGTVRCAVLKARTVSDPSFQYLRLQAELHVRRGLKTSDARAWWRRVCAQGYYVALPQLNNADEIKVQRAGDGDGRPSVVPVQHHVNTGQILKRNKQGFYIEPTEFYEFQTKFMADLNQLGLP